MFLELICFLCGASLAITGSLTFWPVTHWYDFYIPIVLYVAGWIAGIGVLFLIEWIAGLFVNKKKEYNHVSKWARFWFNTGLRFIINHAHIWVRANGKFKIPQKEKFLLVCNHRSKFDNFVITMQLGKRDIAFITKKENKKIPVANAFFNGLCYISIDRDDKMQSLLGFKRAASLIENNIASVGVFPEGTRQTKKVIGDSFHEGAFNIAIHCKAPIVVTALKNTDLIHKRWPWKATLVKWDIVAVLTYDEYHDLPAKAISDKIYKMLEEHLQEM